MKLEIKNLSKTYIKGNNKSLDNLSTEFTSGVYGILGPNGAGKSTLMNIIADNLKADSGEILYNGQNILKLGKDFRNILGYMPQQQGIYKSFTARRFLWYMAALKGIPKNKAKERIDVVLKLVNLQDQCDKKLVAFSGGMKQRILIAQALLNISASPAFVNAGDTALLEGAANGTVIAGIGGVWNEVEIRKVWGDNYGAVKLPTYTVAGQQVQMSSFKGYKMMGVNYYSENKEWALKLADWLTNEQNQTLRFTERSQGPSNKNAAASDAVSQVPAIQAVIAQSEFGVLQRVGNSYWGPVSNFGATMAEGNPKGTNLQEIMDVMVEGITASVGQ